MKFSKFKSVVSSLVELSKKQDEYFNKVPIDLRNVLNNDYIDNLYQCYSVLSEAYFGEVGLNNDVDWFLYDWKPGYAVEVDGVEYKINDIDEYFEYVKKCYEFD